MSFSPWDQKHPRPSRVRRSRAFVFGEDRVRFTFQAADAVLDQKAYGMADDWGAAYVTGLLGREPFTLMTPDGEPAELSEPLLRNIAFLTVAQVETEPPGPEEPPGPAVILAPRFEMLDWYGVAKVFPQQWRLLLAFMDETDRLGQTQPAGDAGNAAGAPGNATTGSSGSESGMLEPLPS